MEGVFADLRRAFHFGTGPLASKLDRALVPGACCPQGVVGVATTGFPQRTLLDSAAGRTDLHGTAGAYRIEQRVAVLLDPAALLAPDRIGGPDLRGGHLPAEAS